LRVWLGVTQIHDGFGPISLVDQLSILRSDLMGAPLSLGVGAGCWVLLNKTKGNKKKKQKR